MAYRATGYLKKVLSDDEVILRITRRHWLVRVFKTMWWALAFWAMAAGAVWLYQTNPAGDDRWMWLAGLALIPLAGWIWEHLVWRNQMNVMTSRRIIQMEGVLNKKVSDSLLEKLNDVKTEQTFIGRIFGFGDILILTASEQGANHLRTIADPLGFKRAMLDAKDALDDDHARAD
ncbi:PH domain-containing protein [Brevundimonas sp.]|uniref:PH domain-containing protein n=1 Tax=Brevundimonas sp. TaxID=1871086 RepID=UPI00391B6B85